MPPETDSVGAGLKEPPFVVPHHYSDINHWKYPERNFYVFICLSVLMGFFGTDHFYLRSFGTATQKFLFNLFTFGMWYVWDLVQIFSDPKRVQAEGLNSPFDWIRGIGRGVFIDPVQAAAAAEKAGASIVRVKKDFAVYALLTIFGGIFGLDKFYIGEHLQGFTKLVTTWFPLTFLFGWMWIFYDIIHTVFYPDSILRGKISAPPPYNLFFGSGISGEPLFMPERLSKEQAAKEGIAAATAAAGSNSGGSGGILGGFANIETFRFLYRELAVPMLQPTVGTTIQQVDHSLKVADKAVIVGNEVAETAPKIASAVSAQIQNVTNPDRMMEQIQAAAAAKASAAGPVAALTAAVPGPVSVAGPAAAGPAAAGPAAPGPAAPRPATAPPAAAATQKGGGHKSGSSSSSGGPIIAGTLSAVVIAGAVKMISELLSDKKR